MKTTAAIQRAAGIRPTERGRSPADKIPVTCRGQGDSLPGRRYENGGAWRYTASWPKLLLLLLAMLAASPGQAETQTFTEFVNTVVPDNSPIGVASTLSVTSSITRITDVNVTLTLSNGWNGDLYAYLVHDTGFAVLLNRTGRTAANPVGYGDRGLSVTFDDQATNGDIHAYRLRLSGNPEIALDGPLTNFWAPDGRAADPALVLDTDARTELLSSFNGLPAAGTWTLFVMDAEPGNESTLANWTLEVAGITGPSSLCVTGLVELEAFRGSSRAVTFKATDTNCQVLKTWIVSLSFAGGSTANYALTEVPLDTVSLSAKTDWNLRRKLGVSFTNNAAVTHFTGTKFLLAGDLDNSNTVNLADYYALASAWYTSNPAADLDGSGFVDLDDYFLLSNHWIQCGDPE